MQANIQLVLNESASKRNEAPQKKMKVMRPYMHTSPSSSHRTSQDVC